MQFDQLKRQAADEEAEHALKAKALQEGGYHFSFFPKVQHAALSRDTHPTSQLELGASLVGAFTVLMNCSPLVADPSHACDRAR